MGLADRDYMKAESWQREQRKRLAEWHWRSLPASERGARSRRLRYLLVALLALIPGGAIGYTIGVKSNEPAEPAPLLVWGGESFTSQAQFERWLGERGISYAKWAGRYPAAAAKLEEGAP